MEKVNVILTFDDGPHLGAGSANRTQRVLSVLDDHDINAVCVSTDQIGVK